MSCKHLSQFKFTESALNLAALSKRTYKKFNNMNEKMNIYKTEETHRLKTNLQLPQGKKGKRQGINE